MALLDGGFRALVGLDEVGRGAWAGPVVAGAVSLDPATYRDPAILAQADDSKRVPAAHRASLAAEVCDVASAAVAWVDPGSVDALGPDEATALAMRAAAAALATTARDGMLDGPGWHARRVSGPPVVAEMLLVDGYPLRDAPAPQRAIVRGDRQCLAIASASLVAKVARDRYMAALARPWPAYGFDRHVGYGTREHFAALLAHGLTPHHRRRFQPMRHLGRCTGGHVAPSLPPPAAAREGHVTAIPHAPTPCPSPASAGEGRLAPEVS